MTKIRVKVSFYDEAGNYFCSAISPQTVVDNGNKKLGCLEIYDCHPRKSNPDGGRKIMMISEYTLSDDVVPRFEVYDAEGHQREDVERKYLVQPIKSSSTMVIKNATAIIFLTPRQPHWDTIQNLIPGYSLKLVAYREGDGMKSRALAFDYTTSCDHQMDGDEDAKIESQDRAKPGAKKRNLNMNRQTLGLQVPNVKRSDSGSCVYARKPPQVYQILNIPKAQEAEDLMNIPTTTLLDPNSPESMVDIQQEQHDSEDSDSDSDSDDSDDSEEEPEDLLNIPTNTLLDINSPERLEDIHQEQLNSEDDQQMELNTPDLETLLPKGTPTSSALSTKHLPATD